MNETDAQTLLSQIPLPPEFTGSIRSTDDGVAVHIDGPDGWICAFSLPAQLGWARDQITAASS